MSLLIICIVLNVSVSLFLEKKKMKVATVAHAVMFAILLFLTMLASANPFIVKALTLVLGTGSYTFLNEVITQGVYPGASTFAPLIFIEVTLFLISLTVGALFAVTVIEKVRLSRCLHDIKIPKSTTKIIGRIRNSEAYLNKIYVLHCSMLC